MKFRKFGQILLASVVSLGLVAGIAACGTSQTGDFVYVASSKNDPGQINVYATDINSGTLRKLNVSPYTEKYRNPVSLVVSPDSKNLYVAYRDDNVIQQFGIGTDGKIYPLNTYNTPGAFPLSMATNAAGTYLYVVDTYQPIYSDASPGPGALIVYPINKDGSLGTALTNNGNQYYAIGMVPTSSVSVTSTLVNVLQDNTTVFVSCLTKSGTQGAIYAFAVGSNGALTPAGSGDASLGATDAGSGIYPAGSQPSAVVSIIKSDSSGNKRDYVYLTDFTQNVVHQYTYTPGSSLTSHTALKTGNNPMSLTIEPRNQFLYVANYADGSLNGYQIGADGSLTNLSTGSNLPTTSAGSLASTGAQPSCVFIEPRFGKYLYTTDFLGNTVSAFQLAPSTGRLVSVQKSPFAAAAQPTCGVAITHGAVSLSTN